jgi:predicted MFS family arabinose efflux permease
LTVAGPDASGQAWRLRALVPTLVLVGAVVAVVSSLGAPLIPTIARTDGVSLSTAQWLLTAALLTGALATPVMGRLADGPRKRQVILIALAVVLVGCVLAAVSDTFIVVVAGRALQGVGLGLLPVTMALARRHLSFEKAAQAIATLSITTAVGAGLGYPLTGLIAQAFNFHAAFWFGAIMVSIALLLAAVILPPASDETSRSFDKIGAAALSLVVIGVSVVLSEGGEWGWTSPTSLGILAACALLLTAWTFHELRFDDPLIDVRQVRNRSVLMADVSGFMICVAMYLFLPIVVEFVQIPATTGYGFGASIVVSGLIFLPLSIGTFAASRCLSIYDRHFGTRSMIPLGSMIFAVATLFFALEHRVLWEAFVSVGFSGIGVGFTFAAMPGFIVRAVPVSETGSATGFYQVLRSIGLSVGSALAAAILTAYTHHGAAFPTTGGFRTALIVASALCVITAVLSYVLPGRSGGSFSARSDAPRGEVDLTAQEEAELAGAGVMLAQESRSPGPQAPPA